MAARRPPQPVAPVYAKTRGAPVVRLAYPFRLGKRWIRSVRLVPPTLADLESFRDLVVGGPCDILAPMSDLTFDVISAMRWPDLESVLQEALPLLPPDLRARLEGQAEPEAEPESEPEAPPADVAAPGESPGPMSDFLIGDRSV